MIPTEPPYLVIPGEGASLSRSELLADLPDADATVLVYPQDMPPALGAGIGIGGVGLVQATEWVLAILPDRFMSICAWIVASYGAKEFLKGFAADAGKDAWKGIKLLLVRIRDWTVSRPSGDKIKTALPLRISAPLATLPGDNRRCSFVLNPNWSNNEAEERLNQLSTQVMLPLISWFEAINYRLHETTDELEVFTFKQAQVEITPHRLSDVWWLSVDDYIGTRVLLRLALGDHSFSWDHGPWKSGTVGDMLRHSLIAFGYRDLGVASLWEQLRSDRQKERIA